MRTARYYETVCLVHGKRKLLHFSKFNPLYRHPVNTGTFYDPLDVSINGVCRSINGLALCLVVFSRASLVFLFCGENGTAVLSTEL